MEPIVRSIVIGAGATLVIDVWAAVLRRLGIPSLDLALLGRWVGHLASGRLAHESIARAAPIAGERALGWATHYVAAGLGYGWLTERGHSDLATMARGGFVYHFGKRFSAGLEAKCQKLDGSALEFWSFGSAMAFGF